jgi:ATP-dependent DNA helicase UvrD/PcrA
MPSLDASKSEERSAEPAKAVPESEFWAHPEPGLNPEKRAILDIIGNVLVVANPGTGKTRLLAHKYARLIGQGVKPEEILCLTYTNKAEDEMRRSITNVLINEGFQVDLASLNVKNFHSYALEQIGDHGLVSDDLLRFAIFKHLKENRILNYEDDYLITEIVPRIEESIRYLKSFGVMPNDVDLAEVQRRLGAFKNQTKQEMDRYVGSYLELYRKYESVKQGRGVDWADMLLEFLRLRAKPQFKHVLVDELQDVSSIEAEIALQSGGTFFVVGDKKQAIFAFQGGSTLNFKKFENSTQRVLSENFRSTNEILDYAKEFFSKKTRDAEAADETRELRNREKGPGPKPKIYNVDKREMVSSVCELVKDLQQKYDNVAVIARTNHRIAEISKEMEQRGMVHSSTSYGYSEEAQQHVARFLLGVLSRGIGDLKNAMLTPFFPASLQDVFELIQLEDEEFTEGVSARCPEFRSLQERTRNVMDVDALFEANLVPVSAAHGREYFLSVVGMRAAFGEAMRILEQPTLDDVVSYLRACDLTPEESQKDKAVVLTTVHKAKGREFPAVVYLPEKSRDTDNFNDEVVSKILETKSIDVEEEFVEEALRIDFVAITRAKDELHIITDQVQYYSNQFSELGELRTGGIDESDLSNRYKRAFALFVDGQADKAKDLLKSKKNWLVDFIRDWFARMDHISPTWLPEGGDESAAQDFLLNRILTAERPSGARELGQKVHNLARDLLEGNSYEPDPDLVLYEENLKTLIARVKEGYPELVAAEREVIVPLMGLVGEGDDLVFKGKIDVIFKSLNGTYEIVDWKTDKKTDNGASHRQQLEAYRHAFALSTEIPIEKIKVAIGYVGLRSTVNTGQIGALFDDRQPADSAYETFTGRALRVVGWRRDPTKFLKDLGQSSEDPICNAIQEQFRIENSAFTSAER